jgi:hypothetical protein
MFKPAFMFAGLILLFILYIRTTHGIDFSDEMQYYGEIKGLIETGQLFSNDLYIQQTVYILFYPVFVAYHLLFDFNGFVFFGRVLIALVSIVVFLYSYHKFVEFKFSEIVSAITALSLTFAIPYHGIFAISYNTISQALWIIFIIQFFEWKPRHALSWAAIPFLTAFAHPTAAVIMSLLIISRFGIEHNFRKIINFILSLAGYGLSAVPVILFFASQQQYLDSLKFSSGYGVGSAFFQSKIGPLTLVFVYLFFGISFIKLDSTKIIKYLHVLFLILFFACLFYATGLVSGGYTYRTVLVLSFISSITVNYLKTNAQPSEYFNNYQINWLIFSILLCATTLGVTSGNGIGQATGALMIGLPLLLALVLSNKLVYEKYDNQLWSYICVTLLSVLFIIHWCRYPYRESFWWNANQPIASSQAFNYIRTTQERLSILEKMTSVFGAVAKDKRTLVVGEFPIIYTLLNMRYETCMLYMHSLTSEKSEKALLDCFENRSPEIIFDINASNDIATSDSKIKTTMEIFYTKIDFACKPVDSLITLPNHSTSNPAWIRYKQCQPSI